MLRWLVRRLLLAVPVVWGVVTISFVLMHLSPGDPARTALGEKADAASVAALRHQWGLDKSLPLQYLDYLGQLVHGDLGQSLYYHSSITSLMWQRLPVTLVLIVFSAILAVLISVPLASRSTTKPNGAAALVVRLFNAVIQGSPTFFIGSMLILFLGVRVAIFPAGGYPSSLGSRAWALVLPALTIALSIVPLLVRGLRAAMIESYSSEYVTFARSKGLGTGPIRRRYVLRNAGISGVSILGIQVGALASGALVIEQVFAIPGMGSMLMTGILNRDYALVQACTLVFGLIVVVVYLVTDIVYARLDPRARLS
ncbi:ABC transporter permease [Flexivirga endophytica]|uniref:ABC transporter permease n=1 Tax=Flexivirga endophytica TaxID=1849103 RepID=A0A916TJY4_9MICO|nr:ABC transporter permease [Flexivirga endophytica]GGB44886.1 ABC transporter permease [Flexivirga endophytica]GHB68790.1 ABC transporter permease [Flexivirga endophytica]